MDDGQDGNPSGFLGVGRVPVRFPFRRNSFGLLRPGRTITGKIAMTRSVSYHLAGCHRSVRCHDEPPQATHPPDWGTSVSA